MKTSPTTWSGQVFIATSLDGFIARPDGDLAWLTDPPSEPDHVSGHDGHHAPPGYEDFTADVTHLVMGRGTYDKVLTFDSWPYDRFRTVVLSTSLPPDADERILVARSIEEASALLAAERAGKVYLDGGHVVSQFLARNLIDELTITRAPILLGAGLPLFHALPHPTRLVHLGTSTTDNGMTTTRHRIHHPRP